MTRHQKSFTGPVLFFRILWEKLDKCSGYSIFCLSFLQFFFYECIPAAIFISRSIAGKRLRVCLQGQHQCDIPCKKRMQEYENLLTGSTGSKPGRGNWPIQKESLQGLLQGTGLSTFSFSRDCAHRRHQPVIAAKQDGSDSSCGNPSPPFQLLDEGVTLIVYRYSLHMYSKKAERFSCYVDYKL